MRLARSAILYLKSVLPDCGRGPPTALDAHHKLTAARGSYGALRVHGPLTMALLACSSGCVSPSGWFATSGPSRAQVENEKQASPQIPVIDVNDEVARKLLASRSHHSFAEALSPSAASPDLLLGPGDVVAISVWEAAPAVLFGASSTAEQASAGVPTRSTAFPDQMVAGDGTISIPFAGLIEAAGKSPHEIEAEIAKRLQGKANQPQVLVSVSRNVTSNVTVVGEVTQSLRMPLTAKGERVLDALAAAGGVRQPLGKMSIQLSRGNKVLTMPLDEIVQDPKQNVPLERGDVLAALYQPLSFTALGATGKNDEINFEAQGISLAQALGRVNGLQDARSDARGVFIFRFEEPSVVQAGPQPLPTTPEGTVPVVYRLDLKDPRSFLVAQDFPMRNKDVVYVANASSAELQKFLTILSTAVYSIYGVVHVTP
jgi:polysaccharide export outer membrane protein